MKIHIYDIEVYKYDWIVTLKDVETKTYTVIHNDNYKLKEFLSSEDIVLGGFNNKHYDDWVLLTMILGGSNVEVKKHNDFIINGGNAWEFPFVSFKKRPFKSFDLRDDIVDKGISLKAIEGNLKMPIIECSIPFDLDRPLTPEELEIVIRYCKHDVDTTERLYEARKENYIDAKILISDMYGVPKDEGIGLTNAKLCAKILGAKAKEYNDERDYVIPDNIDISLIPKVVLDFFMQIRDKSIPDAKLFGSGKGSKGMTLKLWIKTSYGSCPVTFAWGGVHGAKPCVVIEETEERVILNFDVASLYPNSMLNFGYCSRSMEDPEAYRKLVKRRLGYKRDGDKLRSNALKLPINTTYGAMLNPHNDLADRKAGRSVCISNQLAMMMLITKLGCTCQSIDFVNINTDGIMFTINRSEVRLAEKVIADWSKVTLFEMERDDFKKVIQKDVNNYIGITPDGKFKTKGGYVSLYKGGDFKSNSLSIIHKAVVDFLVKGISPETTINECKDIFSFQQIVKTGGTYEGSYHYIDGKRVPIQRVNRIYAVSNPKYGQVKKGKWITEKRKKDKATGKMVVTPVDPPIWSEEVISEAPKHCFIDNENVLKIDDLDKGYYIDLAKKRIDKYINIDKKVEKELSKIKEVVSIMATKTEAASNLNIYGKLAIAREKFLEAPVEKSGINRYAEFKYFELEDIVPVALKIFSELRLSLIESITFNESKATLVNIDNPEEFIVFETPAKDPRIEDGTKMSAIQGLGAYVTYQRRYLYMLVFDIVEADPIDATSGKEETQAIKSEVPKTRKPASPEKREAVKKELIDEDGKATDTQIKSIKNGLKKLRDKNESYEPFIKQSVLRIKSGINKSEAEEILISIGEKIAE